MKDSMATQIDFPDVRVELGKLSQGDQEDNYEDDKDFEEENDGESLDDGAYKDGQGSKLKIQVKKKASVAPIQQAALQTSSDAFRMVNLEEKIKNFTPAPLKLPTIKIKK